MEGIKRAYVTRRHSYAELSAFSVTVNIVAISDTAKGQHMQSEKGL